MLLKEVLSTKVDSKLLNLILTIAKSGEQIGDAVRQGAILGITGTSTTENIQGEVQKQLDVITNDLLKANLAKDPAVKALASEEEDDIVALNPEGEYLVCFDPLDGSSNIDINSLVGTIFSILPAQLGSKVKVDDFLIGGRQQVAAGYILYGAAIQLVLTVGSGVLQFTYDPKGHEYVLTNEAMQIPVDTSEFAINMSNQRFWEKPMQSYISDLLAGCDGPRKRDFNMRWVAAMVGDVHRVLTRGGIFTYPVDTKDLKKPFKLRLLYEANPMAFLVEQACGIASTGYENILDVKPTAIHQRVSVILGSKHEVATCLNYH